MLAESRIVSFLATTDGVRARAFYEGTLGLKVISDDRFATVLDANGVELRIQKVKELIPQAHTALGWSVTAIEKLVRILRAKGVKFENYSSLQQDSLDIWNAPSGARIAWLRDPDGNLLSLTQVRDQ